MLECPDKVEDHNFLASFQLSSSSPSSPESLRQPTSYSSAASKSAAIPSLADMEYREDEIRVQEEIRFHKENPNTCEFCKKKCDVNVEKCVVTGGTHSIHVHVVRVIEHCCFNSTPDWFFVG